LKLQPGDSDAHKYMGLALESVDNLDGALKEYNEALRLDPANAAVYYDIGIILNKRKDYLGAAAAYKKATDLKPREWTYWYNSGVNLNHKGDKDGAIAAYIKAKELNPDSLEVRQNLGAAYCDTHRHAQAITEFRELLKMDPTWNMARACLIKSLAAINDIDGAVKVAEESLRYEPEDTRTLTNLAEWYTEKGRNAEAEALYQREINVEEGENVTANPDLALTLERRAYLFGSEKKYKEAEADLKRAIAIWEKTDTESKQEHLLRITTNYKSMLQKWQGNPVQSESAVIPPSGAATPTDGRAAAIEHWQKEFEAGRKATQEHNYAEAEKILQEAAKDAEAISPAGNQLSMTLQQLAWLYITQRNFVEAEKALSRGIQADQSNLPMHPETLAVDVEALAEVYMMQSKFNDAELQYSRSLEFWEKAFGPRDPRFGNAVDRVANSYSSHQMFDKAEPLYLRYLKMTEEYYGVDHVNVADPIDHLGALYFASHKYEQAEPLYRRALALKEKQFGVSSPMLNGTLHTLADILRNLGRIDEARQLEARREALANAKKN
jgi:tetratricopeptide (TPR) repeat protein